MYILEQNPLKEEGWVLKEAFGVFVAELYGLCLSIAYIVCPHYPYIESAPTL